ncbi:MAG: nicotinamidase [Deltaproteobacteria bacterium]|nr:MAG: nicotinamidase [Deltaproteobacteria bacterium]
MSEPVEPSAGDALLLVDIQNDFLPGGSLAVPDGDAIIAPANACIRAFARRALPIVATRDWHPPDHCSFQAQGGPWPPHCVAGTTGAEFSPALELPASVIVVSKATSSEADAYSGFQGTDLESRLRGLGVRRVFVCGLATDYCVASTVADALASGFETVVVEDAIRAVDVEPGDGERAKGRMCESGARMIGSSDIAP